MRLRLHETPMHFESQIRFGYVTRPLDASRLAAVTLNSPPPAIPPKTARTLAAS
jgi:hypothetical protein